METLIGVLISIAGLIFGIYQWRRQRGKIRFELNEMQSTIHLNVRSESPMPITVQGIRYELRSNRLMLRTFVSILMRKADDTPLSFTERVKSTCFIHNIVALGWCKPISDDRSSNNPRESRRKHVSTPIIGPAFPTKIDGYHDVSWEFDIRDYAELFQEREWIDVKELRLGFVAKVAGHPRRIVKSRWLDVKNMHALAPSNAWLFEDVDGWPFMKSK